MSKLSLLLAVIYLHACSLFTISDLATNQPDERVVMVYLSVLRNSLREVKLSRETEKRRVVC